jgi:hypothetical protein
MLKPSSGDETSDPRDNALQRPGIFRILRVITEFVIVCSFPLALIIFIFNLTKTPSVKVNPNVDPAGGQSRVETDWEKIHEVVVTRGFLERLERASKEIPRLKEHLQKLEDDGLFDKEEFRQGPRSRLVKLWRERKDYPTLIWTSELRRRRAALYAAHDKEGRNWDVISKWDLHGTTYEFAGKLLGLPVKDGKFVETELPPAGPEAVMFDLMQIEAGLKGP